tara:strand:- start:2284 stop:3576 length:1293 start_codon:yes stop_codon:yes gene_type:complete
MESKTPEKKINAFVSTEVPITPVELKATDQNNKDYIPFGSDNLYPQALASLCRKSISLRGTLDSKVIYTVAAGFKIDEGNTAGTDFIDSVNSKEQSLSEVYEDFSTDKNYIGNAYLEIVTDNAQKEISFNHIQAVKCRVSKDKESILIHPNWAKESTSKSLTKTIAIYPNFTEDGNVKRSIWHQKDYEPDFDNYGIPKYIAAMDAAAIGYKTNKWNVSRLDNSFQSSGVLLIDGNMSPDDANDLKTEINSNLVGEGNQGKLLTIIKKLGGEDTSFTPINDNTEGDWINLHNQSNDDILIACNWKKSLANISENTGFDTDRILNDYQIVSSTYLIKEQNKFIKKIQKIALTVVGLDLEGLHITNKSPVSLLTKLSADKYIKIWEARRLAGEDYDAEDEEQQKYVEEVSSSSTTKETTAIAKGFDKIKAYLK